MDAVFFVVEEESDSTEAALRGEAATGLADTSGSGLVLVLGIVDFFLGVFLTVDFVFFFSFLVKETVASTLFASAWAAAACCLFSLRRDEERIRGFAGSRLGNAASLEWTDGVLRFFEDDDFGEGEGAILQMRLIPM